MIELENITRVYDLGELNIAALNDISFHYVDGEMISFYLRDGHIVNERER